MSNEPSEACCTVPAVVTDDYTAKGTYQPYGGIEKAYVTGPKNTGRALVVIFDIFGYFPQTLQGADILGEAVNAWVVMPDFVHGEPFPIENFPPKTDEHKAALANFFKTTGSFATKVPEVSAVCEALKKEGYDQVGVLGYCWGGKVSTLTGAKCDFVDAVASVHPAMISAADAEELKVPMGFFISGDEDKAEADKFYEGISAKPWGSKNAYKTYKNMIHGWAAARGDLKNEENLKEYNDVYSQLATFYNGAFAK